MPRPSLSSAPVTLYAIRGALLALARDASTGRLTPLASYPRPAGSAALAISPDGQHVYVAGAAAVAVSLDGEWVYFAGSNEGAIAIFHVDAPPILHDGTPCEFDEDCASGVCDFLLRGPGEGESAGPLFPKVCCQRRCTLEEACDSTGMCQPRLAPS